MKQIPTEDLKLLAERMGLKPSIQFSNLPHERRSDCVKIRAIVKSCDERIKFTPTESADQCLMVLEWLKPEIRYIDNVVMGHWMVWKPGVGDFITEKDLKTAVTLAAIEYCKQ